LLIQDILLWKTIIKSNEQKGKIQNKSLCRGKGLEEKLGTLKVNEKA
jgi:hypothetical protein